MYACDIEIVHACDLQNVHAKEAFLGLVPSDDTSSQSSQATQNSAATTIDPNAVDNSQSSCTVSLPPSLDASSSTVSLPPALDAQSDRRLIRESMKDLGKLLVLSHPIVAIYL